jgi:hypothetical protein
MQVRVLSISPPGAAAQPAPAVPPGIAVVSGTVDAVVSNGQPLLVTSQGALVLNTRATVPPGSTVTLGFLPDTAATLTATDATTRQTSPLPATMLATTPLATTAGVGWPALSRSFEVLASINPAAAETLRDAIVPRANTKLAGAMMGMLSALRGGNVGAWMGTKALEVLGRQSSAITRQLSADFSALRHTARDAGGDEWRGYTLPLDLQGGMVAPIHLHVRAQDRDEEEKDHRARRNGSVRFVIDLHLSQLGPLQMEGLARSEEQRLDMVIRSREPLPSDIRREVQRLYTAALEATGQKGGLVFQLGEQSWLKLARQRSGGPMGMEA